MPLRDRVISVVARVFAMKPGDLKDEHGPDEIRKWDSLGHMELIVQLEKEFGIQYEVDELTEANSVGKIVSQLRARGIADE